MAATDGSTEIANRFVVIARQYCALIDSTSNIEKSELLAKIYRILPSLIGEAIRLPEIDLAENEDSRSAGEYIDKTEGFKKLYEMLKGKFGNDDIYSTVFDPTIKDNEAIHGSLADDIADIYLDLKDGLTLVDKRADSLDTAIWDWRLLFYSHWGDHAMSALRTIHSLLDEALE
jgi:hypothetical protein